MERDDEKLSVGGKVALGFLGVAFVVSLPVIALAYGGVKLGEKLGLENRPTNNGPYDL